jgi:hypothetical protein
MSRFEWRWNIKIRPLLMQDYIIQEDVIGGCGLIRESVSRFLTRGSEAADTALHLCLSFTTHQSG